MLTARLPLADDATLRLIPVGQCIDYLSASGRDIGVKRQWLHRLVDQGTIPGYRTLTTATGKAGARPVVLVDPEAVWTHFAANPPAKKIRSIA